MAQLKSIVKVVNVSAEKTMASAKNVGDKIDELQGVMLDALEDLKSIQISWFMRHSEIWKGYLD